MRKSIKKIGAIALAAALALSYAPISPFGQITAKAEPLTQNDPVIEGTKAGVTGTAPVAEQNFDYDGFLHNLTTQGEAGEVVADTTVKWVFTTDAGVSAVPTDAEASATAGEGAKWSYTIPRAKDAGTYTVKIAKESYKADATEDVMDYKYTEYAALTPVVVSPVEPTVEIATISGTPKVGVPTNVVVNVSGIEGGDTPAGTITLTANKKTGDSVGASVSLENASGLEISDGSATYAWTPATATEEGTTIVFTAKYVAKTAVPAEKNYKDGTEAGDGYVTQESGVTVEKGDIVAPSITAKLSDNTTVVANGGDVALTHDGSAVAAATVTLTDGATDASDCTYEWSLASDNRGTAYTGGDTPDALEDSQVDNDVVLTLNEAGTVFVKCVKTRENYADATPVYFSVKGVVTPTVTVTKTDPASVTTTSDIKITVDTGIAALADATVAVKVYKKADEGDTYSNTPETITISAPEAAAMKLDNAGKLTDITFKIPATGTYKVVATVTTTNDQQTAGYVAGADGGSADIEVSGTSISTATIKNNAGNDDAEKSAGTATYAPSGLAIPALTVTLADGETVLNATTDYDLWTKYGADEATANSASAVEGTTIANAGVYLVFAKGKGIYQDMTSTSYKYTVSKANDTIDLSSLTASFDYGEFTKYANVKSTGDQSATFTYKKFDETPAEAPEASSETYGGSGLGGEIADADAVATLDAGTYIAKATTAASDNYNAADAYKIFTINPVDVTITAYKDEDCTQSATSVDVTSSSGATFYISTGVAGLTSSDGSIRFFEASTGGESLATISAAAIASGKSTVTIASGDVSTLFGDNTTKTVYAQFTQGSSKNYKATASRLAITLKKKTAITAEMIGFYLLDENGEINGSKIEEAQTYNPTRTYNVGVKVDADNEITDQLTIVVEQTHEFGQKLDETNINPTIQNAGVYQIKSITGNDTYTCQLTTSELNAIKLTINQASLPDSAELKVNLEKQNADNTWTDIANNGSVPYGTNIRANKGNTPDGMTGDDVIIQYKTSEASTYANFVNGAHGDTKDDLEVGTYNFVLTGQGNYSPNSHSAVTSVTVAQAPNTVTITVPKGTTYYTGSAVEGVSATDVDDINNTVDLTYKKVSTAPASDATQEALGTAFSGGTSVTNAIGAGNYIVKAVSALSKNYSADTKYAAFTITPATGTKSVPETKLHYSTEAGQNTGTISLGTLPTYVEAANAQIAASPALVIPDDLKGVQKVEYQTDGSIKLTFKALEGTDQLAREAQTITFILTDADGNYEVTCEVNVTLTTEDVYTVKWTEGSELVYNGEVQDPSGFPKLEIYKNQTLDNEKTAAVTYVVHNPADNITDVRVAQWYTRIATLNDAAVAAQITNQNDLKKKFLVRPRPMTVTIAANSGTPVCGAEYELTMTINTGLTGALAEAPGGNGSIFEGTNGHQFDDTTIGTYTLEKKTADAFGVYTYTIKATPKKVGEQSWYAVFASFNTNHGSTLTDRISVTVNQGTVAITAEDIDVQSITNTSAKIVIDTKYDGDLQVAVVPKTNPATEIQAADWKDCTNGEYTASGLTRNTEYNVFVRSKNPEGTPNFSGITAAGSANDTFTTMNKSSGTGGGSTTPDTPSGGDSGSGSGGGSTTPGKTETTTNPDGSTTETTTNPDGSKEEKTTEPDGTVVDTVTDKDGNTSTTTTNPDGSEVTETMSTEKEGTKETTTVTTVETDAEGNVTSSTESVTTTDKATGETTSKVTTTDETGTTEEVSTTKIENGLKVTEETVTQTDANGNVTYEKESTETYNPSTGYTTTESTTTMADGTKIEASTMESPTGENASSVTTTTNPDGSTEVVVMEKTNADGVQSESLSTTTTEADGSSVTESAEKVVDSNTGITTETETKIEVAANGDVTSQATEEKSLPSNVKVTTTNSTYTPAGGETQASTTISLSDPVVGTVDDVASGVVEGGQVYRVYNPNSGEHMFTRNAAEVANLVSLGWNNETPADGDAAITVDDPDAAPVYRVYNPNEGKHHFTKDANEASFLASIGWNMEGIAFFVYDAESGAGNPEYRVYNPNTGDHHWTSDAAEKDALVALGWNDEGVAWNIK